MLPCYHFTMLPNPAQHQVLGIPARRSCSLYYIYQPKDDIDNGFIAWIMSKFTMTAMVMMVMVTIVVMMLLHRGSTDSGIRSDDQLEVQVPLLFSFPFFSIFFSANVSFHIWLLSSIVYPFSFQNHKYSQLIKSRIFLIVNPRCFPPSRPCTPVVCRVDWTRYKNHFTILVSLVSTRFNLLDHISPRLRERTVIIIFVKSGAWVAQLAWHCTR